MKADWFQIYYISYGWFGMRIGSDVSEASDYLGYDMPKKFLSKVMRVISKNTEEWLYFMDEPGAGILHIYYENEQIHFEEYDLAVDSYELNREDEEAEWGKRSENSRFHVRESIQNVVDGIVSEFSLYENGNGRKLYERHWGGFPEKEFEELKKYAFQLQKNAGKHEGLYCTTFLEGKSARPFRKQLSDK